MQGMYGRSVVWCVTVSFLIWLTSDSASAQETTQRLSYWLPKPAVLHFDTPSEAADNLKTLKELGCQAEQHQHDGHIDVRWECAAWRSLKLADQQEVVRWRAWLQKKGFTVVLNTPAADHPEIVTYQLPKWQTYHFNEPGRAETQVALFKMLGCETKTAKHNGHDDVAARLTQWQQIGLATHAEAHMWINSLQKLGFATQHEH